MSLRDRLPSEKLLWGDASGSYPRVIYSGFSHYISPVSVITYLYYQFSGSDEDCDIFIRGDGDDEYLVF